MNNGGITRLARVVPIGTPVQIKLLTLGVKTGRIGHRFGAKRNRRRPGQVRSRGELRW